MHKKTSPEGAKKFSPFFVNLIKDSAWHFAAVDMSHCLNLR